MWTIKHNRTKILNKSNLWMEMEVIGFEENAEFLKFIWAQISNWHLVEFMLPGNVLCVWWLNKDKPVNTLHATSG